jgi:hypothetical protein
VKNLKQIKIKIQLDEVYFKVRQKIRNQILAKDNPRFNIFYVNELNTRFHTRF